MLLRCAVTTLSVGMMALGSGVVSGQNFPSKPIRIIATAPPGGGLDFIGRLISPALSSNLGQPVIVDNRGGANGAIGAEIAAKAPPDGYTIILVGNNFWTLPFLQDNVPYNPAKDFAPITWATRASTFLVVHPSLPVKSVKELIALAKASPGQLNYGTGSNGSVVHLAAELFKAMAGVDIVKIAYKGSGPAITGLVGGQVNMMFADGVLPFVKSGKLRALAVTSPQPSPLVPDVPTVASSGLPGFEAMIMFGLLAPTGTPAPIINRLNEEIVRVLNRAEVKERFSSHGSEVVGSSPQEYATKIKSELAKWGKLIKDAGVRAE